LQEISRAKASAIAISTLQAYESGSKPGLDALVSLARTGNVCLDWLLTGKGEKRPSGMLPGKLLAEVIMVDQYQPGTSLNFSTVNGISRGGYARACGSGRIRGQAARREDDARGARPVRQQGGAGEAGAAHGRRAIGGDEALGKEAEEEEYERQNSLL
jgi:hypothetical protein